MNLIIRMESELGDIWHALAASRKKTAAIDTAHMDLCIASPFCLVVLKKLAIIVRYENNANKAP
ncbi:hypothetical protein [Desulfovermiculus halophilus]|uniref:hypothetical protein n=1 Tax=Desulfovermiculus halophilus TaxID=339722 RepID=UPI00129463ED|nr:hypothetical protein [Desulfovermiculus halophilus]